MVIIDCGLTLSAPSLLAKFKNDLALNGVFLRIFSIFPAVIIVSIAVRLTELLPNEVYVYVSFLIVALAYALIPYWFLNASGNTQSMAYSYGISRVLSLGVLAVYVYYSPSLPASITGFSLSLLLSAALSTIGAIRQIMTSRGRITMESLRRIARYVFHPAISNILSAIFSSSLIIIIGLYYGSGKAGDIAVPDRIIKFVMAMFAPLTNSFLPQSVHHFIQHYESGRRFILSRLFYIIVGYLFISLILMAFSDTILRIFSKPSFEARAYLAILCAWGGISLVNNLLGVQYLVGQGKSHIYARIFNVSAIILIILLLSSWFFRDNIFYPGVCILATEFGLLVYFFINFRNERIRGSYVSK